MGAQRPGTPGIAWDAWRAERTGADAVLRRQRARLAGRLRPTPALAAVGGDALTAADTLAVRLEPEPGADPARVRAAVDVRLAAFLDDRGLGAVTVRHCPEPPAADPRSGKFQEVWAA